MRWPGVVHARACRARGFFFLHSKKPPRCYDSGRPTILGSVRRDSARLSNRASYGADERTGGPGAPIATSTAERTEMASGRSGRVSARDRIHSYDVPHSHAHDASPTWGCGPSRDVRCW